MIRLALTGSIGMGKSTTASLFADEGVPVWDADAAVHRLYGPGAAGAQAIAALAADAVGEAGVDRARLRAAIVARPGLLAEIEAAVHPLVAKDRAEFLEQAEREGAPAALCDIPLLYETGGETGFDAVVAVTAPAEVQRARVLERPGMDEASLAAVLARQVPDAEKRARADYVVDTSRGLEPARAQVREILRDLGLRT
ncbi:MAG TPA: dephospho-CoA kinase [Thermohalobaculum sp.]|nr:dephospho-CoA kinase [Thermohalobaculum sp.]